MKKIFILAAMAIALAAYAPEAQAQGFLKGLADKAKEKLKEKVSNKVEDKVGNAADDVLNGNISSKKGSKKSKEVDNEEITASDNAPLVNTSTDFKRGGKILFQDDFKGETVGEFPSKWELNDGKAEVKTFNGEKVIEITNGGYITPLIKQEGAYLTEEFTVEFTYYYWPEKEGVGLNDIKLFLNSDTDRSRSYGYVSANEEIAFAVGLPVVDGSNNVSYEYYNGKKAIHGDAPYKFTKGWHTVQVSFNKRALKLYVDGKRIINLPQVAQPTWMALQVPFDYENITFVKEVVIAQGAVKLYDRNAQDLTAVEKAMAETGKFVTNNILFETGKADLKAESMEEIQKVADYMKKNSSARFLVVGHTDNVGNAASNQTLSENRAKSVVAALAKLGVDDFNLKAEGRGASEPVADNKTAEGKAKNRRVEFIKK